MAARKVGGDREERTRALRDVLQEAGLTGRVRLGMSPSADVGSLPRHPRTAYPSPGTEEGVSPLDALLRPQSQSGGRLIEIAGSHSSGCTALAYRLVAGATRRGELAGWVDPADALDPRFLHRAGVGLERVLWVCPPSAPSALRAAELLLRAGLRVVVVDLEGADPRALAKLGSAAWTRLARAARGARATAVLLGTARACGAFATLGIHTERRRAVFDRGLFEGFESLATAVRDREAPAGASAPFRAAHRPS